MKRSDIKIGKTYSNGTGACHRQVLGFGRDNYGYESVRYKQIKSNVQEYVGRTYTILMSSFQVWAKREV